MFTTPEFRNRPRRARRLLLIVLVAATVVVGLIVWATGSGGPGPSPAASTQVRPTQQAPAGLEWRLVNGVRLPFSAVDGPTGTQGPQPTGFSHTPQGAVIAAWQLSTRLMTDPDTDGLLARVHGTYAEQQQIRDEVSAGRSLTAEQRAAVFPQPVAYKIDTWTPGFATFYFALPSPQGGFSFQARAVVWTGTDWEYQLVSGLDPLPNSTDLTGFTSLQ